MLYDNAGIRNLTECFLNTFITIYALSFIQHSLEYHFRTILYNVMWKLIKEKYLNILSLIVFSFIC